MYELGEGCFQGGVAGGIHCFGKQVTVKAMDEVEAERLLLEPGAGCRNVV